MFSFLSERLWTHTSKQLRLLTLLLRSDRIEIKDYFVLTSHLAAHIPIESIIKFVGNVYFVQS